MCVQIRDRIDYVENGLMHKNNHWDGGWVVFVKLEVLLRGYDINAGFNNVGQQR